MNLQPSRCRRGHRAAVVVDELLNLFLDVPANQWIAYTV